MSIALHMEQSPRKPFWLRNPERQQAIALGLGILGSIIDIVRALLLSAQPLVAIAVVLTAGGAVLSRRLPGWGTAVTIVGTILTLAGDWDPIVQYSVVAFTAFGVAVRGYPAARITIFGALALGAAFAANSAVRGISILDTDFYAAMLGVLAGGATGTALSAQARYWDSLEQRAVDAVERGEVEAERRAAEERLRIARDLHDIIGHNVAVISMHLGAVEVSAGRDQPVLERSLAAARSAVQSVLRETQQTLRLIRADQDTPNADALQPTASLANLDELIGSFRQIGLRIDYDGDLAGLDADPGVELVAYRLVQEALTNAQRYGSGEVTLDILLDGDEILVAIENSTHADATSSAHLSQGRSGSSPGGGYGLIGMRERVASVGGLLTLERAADTFSVRATLPVSGLSSEVRPS